MRLRLIALMSIVFIAMYVGYQQIAAQNLVTCPGLVQQAIQAVGNNCGGLNRNSACYGFNDVNATFSVPQPVSYFSAPSDRAGLVDLQDLNTSPMNQTLDSWGIALLSVQANLPDTLPGQSVVFMLLGDTQVENAVSTDQAFQTGATVNVTLQIGADLYSSADFNAQVVGSVPQGTSLTSDAISADGQWVRVVYRGVPGWITKQVLTHQRRLEHAAGHRTGHQDADAGVLFPHQRLRDAVRRGAQRARRPGTAEPDGRHQRQRRGHPPRLDDCDLHDAGRPGDAAVPHRSVRRHRRGHAADADRRPRRARRPQRRHARRNRAETGETTFICLSNPENLGTDGQPNDRTVFAACPWAPPRPVTAEDIARFRELDGMTLNYPIDLPIELPTLTPTASDTPRPQAVFVAAANVHAERRPHRQPSTFRRRRHHRPATRPRRAIPTIPVVRRGRPPTRGRRPSPPRRLTRRRQPSPPPRLIRRRRRSRQRTPQRQRSHRLMPARTASSSRPVSTMAT